MTFLMAAGGGESLTSWFGAGKGLALIESNREGLHSLKGIPCTTDHHEAGSPPWTH